jgi:hypothetical protein
MLFSLDQRQRAEAFARSRGLVLTKEIGSGEDGAVWKTGPNRETVVKAFERPRQYGAELGCYQRLREQNVRKIGRFFIPRLIDWDEELLVIEISLLTSPPYILDFGKAYLDFAPEHSEETWAEHESQQRDWWGEKYPEVLALLWQLEQIGIHYRDAKPGNIEFPQGEWDSDCVI